MPQLDEEDEGMDGTLFWPGGGGDEDDDEAERIDQMQEHACALIAAGDPGLTPAQREVALQGVRDTRHPRARRRPFEQY